MRAGRSCRERRTAAGRQRIPHRCCVRLRAACGRRVCRCNRRDAAEPSPRGSPPVLLRQALQAPTSSCQVAGCSSDLLSKQLETIFPRWFVKALANDRKESAPAGRGVRAADVQPHARRDVGNSGRADRSRNAKALQQRRSTAGNSKCSFAASFARSCRSSPAARWRWRRKRQRRCSTRCPEHPDN